MTLPFPTKPRKRARAHSQARNARAHVADLPVQASKRAQHHVQKLQYELDGVITQELTTGKDAARSKRKEMTAKVEPLSNRPGTAWATKFGLFVG